MSSTASIPAAWKTAWSTCSTPCRRERYRHTVVALTDYSDFRHRITAQPVAFHALHRPPGHGLGWTVRLVEAVAPAQARSGAHAQSGRAGSAVRRRGRRHSRHRARRAWARRVRSLWPELEIQSAAPCRPAVRVELHCGEPRPRNLAAPGHPRAAAQAAPDLQRRRQREIPSARGRAAANLPIPRASCSARWGAWSRSRITPRSRAPSSSWCASSPSAPSARGWSSSARGRRAQPVWICCRTPAWRIWPGCRASATTLRTSCRRSMCSCCRRKTRASPIPSWKRWRAGCR